MAELTPIPSAQRPAEPGYQPLSGYAVAAAVTAGLFALILVILVVVGLTSNRTPLTYQLLAVAVAGVVLAIVGRSHIRNSEGTRTGLQLANGAWWVCVLGGAGFAAFLLANEFVLTNESQRRADGFFEALKAGKEHEAFHDYVLPPELRGRVPDVNSPDFETVYMPAGYVAFAGHRVLQALRQNRGDVKIEHIGAKDVGQEGLGFKATHIYRVTVAEGVFTVQIKMIASESKAGGKPQWHVQGAGGLALTDPNWEYFSQFGRVEMEAVEEATKFGRAWMYDLSNGRPGLAHLSILPRADREKVRQAFEGSAQLAGAAAYAVPAPGGPGQEFEQLVRAGFFRADEAGNPLPDSKAAQLAGLWSSPSLTPASGARRNPMANTEVPEVPTMTLTPATATVSFPADLVYGPGGRNFAPVTVGVVCSDPELVALLNSTRAKGAGAKDDGTVSIRTLPPRDWRIGWFQTTMEQPVVPSPADPRFGGGGPGGPGGAGGP